MKVRYTVMLSMLAGAVAGAAAIQALHAQAKPPVYVIAINEISNQEGYTKQYLPTAQKTIKDHGGVYVAAGPGTQIDREPEEVPRPRAGAEVLAKTLPRQG